MQIEYRPVTDDEVLATVRMEEGAFGNHFDEARLPWVQEWFRIGRSVAAFDGGEPVGLTMSYPLDMTVPGGRVTTASIGNVSVLTTHRRRGILTEMMRRQLTSAYENGLLVSPLGASEARIYGRFGYGIACEHEGWTIDRRRSAFRQEYPRGGYLKIVTSEHARKVFPEVYRRVAARRAGMILPPKPWWDDTFDDKKRGQNANFYVEYREADIEGYAIYRIKEGIVTVWDLTAHTDTAYSALWRYCLDIDLTKTIKVWGRPTDDPLIWMLDDPRALKRKPYDQAWLRLIDVPKALSARTYARDDTLVFDVQDDFCPWNKGVYELAGGPAGGMCKATSKAADLVLSAGDLAVPYLGGSPFTPLARAGRVEERTSGALRRADAMFATQLKPWSPMLT